SRGNSGRPLRYPAPGRQWSPRLLLAVRPLLVFGVSALYRVPLRHLPGAAGRKPSDAGPWRADRCAGGTGTPSLGPAAGRIGALDPGDLPAGRTAGAAMEQKERAVGDVSGRDTGSGDRAAIRPHALDLDQEAG